MQVSFLVVIPQPTVRQIGVTGGSARERFPVLWLLHGLSDDHTIWLRRTSIERYATERGLAVVMPAVGRSFYQDTVSGAAYWRFLSDELPELCRDWFPISAAREDNFAAGLSMGGYGALRLVLAYPERYAAGASLSGAVDVNGILAEARRSGSPLPRRELEGTFGPDLDVAGTDADLFHLSQHVAGRPVGEPPPALYVSCGTEDALLASNRSFHEHLEAIGLAHVYAERPGAHDWAFWDDEIQRVLDWLPR
jgi:S-formylglutathione hydrolase FrmB